jgi:hypothetical protein
MNNDYRNSDIPERITKLGFQGSRTCVARVIWSVQYRIGNSVQTKLNEGIPFTGRVQHNPGLTLLARYQQHLKLRCEGGGG